MSEVQTCDVSRSEEELGLVIGKKGCMPAAFLLVQGVDLALELAVRLYSAGLASHLQAIAHTVTLGDVEHHHEDVVL